MDGPDLDPNEEAVPESRANDPSTYAKPGDPIMDSKTQVGYALIGLGGISFVLALLAAAYDFNGWLLILIPACIVFIAAGVGWILYERKQTKDKMDDETGGGRARVGVPPSLRRKWRMSRGA